MKQIQLLFYSLLISLLWLVGCSHQPSAAVHGNSDFLVTEDELVGQQVYDQNNVALGVVEQLLLTSGEGQIDYIVLRLNHGPYSFNSQSGEIWGEPADLLPIPWSLFTINNTIILNEAAAKLRTAPHFATIESQDWSTTIVPYWESNTSETQ